MNVIILIIIAAVPAYFLGSLNGAIITSKLFYRKDIREFGSGNAGLTNFFRTFGKGGALLVIFIDFFKTVTPVIFGGWLLAEYTDMPVADFWMLHNILNISLFGVIISGLFVMLGHCYPMYYKFKGGKGVMTAGVIVIVLDWRLALICWGIFILITLLTRYVSLASLIGSASIPIFQFFVFHLGGIWELIVCLLCVLLIFIRHETNIRRLIKGQETKLTFKRKKT